MYIENNSKWLFKYMPFNLNTVKLLINSELWFGKPDIQNDPNEAEFILNYGKTVQEKSRYQFHIDEDFKSIIKETYSGKNYPTGYERIKFEKQLKERTKEYLGICSMSIKLDDILMWSHYADCNKGICLVFNKEVLTEKLFGDKAMVDYSNTIANANFSINGNFGELIYDTEFYFTKLDNWAYEKEFRFIRRFQELIPQKDINRTVSFPEDALIGVILGEKFPKEDFKTLMNLVYAKNPNRTFHFWRCLKNLYKQSMDITYSAESGHPFRKSPDTFLVNYF
ncbi:MAG: hypothetical protein COC06_10520 [Bacteroidales bacterium]|nr:MAG: hypothetical protein COC06_10520 [Bacteroidales bacterium]